MGRFSQVENVTLNEPYRKPWNTKGYGATRTLTEDFFPTGLVKLSFLSLEEFKQEEQEKIRVELELGKREQARINQQQAEQERLAAMLPEERMLERIKNLKNDPNEVALLVQECFKQDLNSIVFSALKNRLQQLGQWIPAGSKKRKEKMQVRNERIEKKISN